jgi:two-component system, chemotaxis family, sensor histidine kinase and response regulator WspE
VTGLGAFSMWDLFRSEVESQMRVLTEGLLALEGAEHTKEHLAAGMRAAHSIKGAARIVQLDVAVTLAHAMEDVLVAAQEGALALTPAAIDVLLSCGDLLSEFSKVEESGVPEFVAAEQTAIDSLLGRLADVKAGKLAAEPPRTESAPQAAAIAPAVEPPAAGPAPPVVPSPAPVAPAPPPPTVDDPHQPAPAKGPTPIARIGDGADRALKVGAHTLNRLMGLAGESLVQSRWFESFSVSLLSLKRRHHDIEDVLESLRAMLDEEHGSPELMAAVVDAEQRIDDVRQKLAEQHAELEAFGVRSSGLSDRLYRDVVSTRMQPFGDGVEGFPRLVRDVARQLGKQVRLDVVGRSTEVDREILERLEAPLNHAIRNSLDHGIGTPASRVASGKPACGTIRLEARHRAGLFVLTVSDDGRGVDIEKLRAKVIAKGLAAAEMAQGFSETELLEFLFLPGFSTAETVTQISGRGVGLDAVREMATSVGGAVRIESRAGQGMSIHFELPLTLSVVRTFVAEIAGEPYAVPMTRVSRLVKVDRSELSTLEGQQYFDLENERIGVVSAREVLDIPGTPTWGEEISVVLLGDRTTRYGLAVDKFVGEFDMVVRPLDARLGKVADVAAAALMEDGSPVLILDVEDLTRSVETALRGGRLRGLGKSDAGKVQRKRILVVDDSLTVREAEQFLLHSRGYDVEVAVDGMDGWNALKASHYDMIVTDVDMPRMTGLELVAKIKADQKLQGLPVIIVSYKDRDEDRLRGLDAGADRYMTKSSFHDETLLAAITELIGPPR